MLELEDGRFLPESGAILTYLAEGSDFLPQDRYERAQCLGWMFFEQYSHEPAIAARRSIAVYPERAKRVSKAAKLALLEKGNIALDVMETQLQKTAFLIGSFPTIADVALYAEGANPLRVEGLPNYAAMSLEP